MATTKKRPRGKRGRTRPDVSELIVGHLHSLVSAPSCHGMRRSGYERMLEPFKGPNGAGEWIVHLLHLASQVRLTFHDEVARPLLFVDRVRQLRDHFAHVNLETLEALVREHEGEYVELLRERERMIAGFFPGGNHRPA